jgi:F0F1-type ATP synthase membrane subunit c/vacuolar-type H+-ATPase subunit K
MSAAASAKTWLGVVQVLKIGYGLMMLAGACLIGYAGYHVVGALVASPAIPAFFKGLILLAALGVIVTLIGLVRERRREEKDDPIDDGSD